MQGQKNLLYRECRINGLTYILKITAETEFPSSSLPNANDLYVQFCDIARNHAEFVNETLDKEATLRTARQQAEEYRTGKPTPLRAVMNG